MSEFRRAPSIIVGQPSNVEWSKDYVYAAGRAASMKENLKPQPPAGLVGNKVWDGVTCTVSLSWVANTESDLSDIKFNAGERTCLRPGRPSGSTDKFTLSLYDPTGYPASTILQYRVVAVDDAGYTSEPSAILRFQASDQSGPSKASALSHGRRPYCSPDLDCKHRHFRSGWISSSSFADTPPGDVPVALTTNLVQDQVFVDSNLSNGTMYYYRIRARDTAGNWGPYITVLFRASGMGCAIRSVCQRIQPPLSTTECRRYKGMCPSEST